MDILKMSYNQTNNIHNPFEGEELEKRQKYNTKKLERQITDAMKNLRNASEAMNKATDTIKESAGKIAEAGNMLELLKLYEEDKKSRVEIRTGANMLRSVSRDINGMILSKVPDFRIMDFAMEVGHVLESLDRINKRRR